MIKLEPFTEQDFEQFKSWITNKEELFQFAGPIFDFPISDEQLRSYINMTDKKPFKVILLSTNETIGHCELNFTDGINRLSRILIGNKNLRGKKIGEQLVKKMVDLFFESPTLTMVDLNVFDWNKGAIKCYQNVGFNINPAETEDVNINGEIWTKLNMILNRAHYKK
jgi:RimJ/RimL family protein N-acetyltransferase